MTKFTLRYLIAFLLLIPAQAIVFNRLILFNVAVPEVFVYLIVMLPITMSVNSSMLLSFLAGIVLDAFCDTPGVNACSATLLSFVRNSVFHLYVSVDDDLASRIPSSISMGYAAFSKYVLTMSFIYCTILFTIESFQFFNIGLLLLRIISSTIYTFLVVYALNCIAVRPRES